MFERFSRSAREAVVAARSEAGRLGHHFVGTEHLLLGLLAADPPDAGSTGTSVAATVLSGAGLDAAYTRSQIVKLVGNGRLGDEEADALRSIGIDLDTVRSRLEASFGEGVLDRPEPPRHQGRTGFTARSKKVLALSAREARVLGSDSIGAEHILLGLVREGAGVAALILAAKAPLSTFRERVLAELDRAA